MWINRARQSWLTGPQHALITPLKTHDSRGQVSRKGEAERMEGPYMFLSFLRWDLVTVPCLQCLRSSVCPEEGKRNWPVASDTVNNSLTSLIHLRKQTGSKLEIPHTEEGEEPKPKPFQGQMCMEEVSVYVSDESGPVPGCPRDLPSQEDALFGQGFERHLLPHSAFVLLSFYCSLIKKTNKFPTLKFENYWWVTGPAARRRQNESWVGPRSKASGEKELEKQVPGGPSLSNLLQLFSFLNLRFLGHAVWLTWVPVPTPTQYKRQLGWGVGDGGRTFEALEDGVMPQSTTCMLHRLEDTILSHHTKEIFPKAVFWSHTGQSWSHTTPLVQTLGEDLRGIRLL